VVSRPFIKLRAGLWLLLASGAAAAAESPVWVERLAFWAAPELQSLKSQVAKIDQNCKLLPSVAGVNSGNRSGFRSAGMVPGEDMWVEVEFTAATPVDTVVLVPLLAKGSSGEVPGFGFPRRFLLEGFDESGETILLMDETAGDYPNPGLYPVAAACPLGERLQRIRLTATEPWESDGEPVLALSEIMVLRGNRNLAPKARVEASSAREVPPAWSRKNLSDMMTPLGLPVAPAAGAQVMGWHGPVAASINEVQAFTVDLGKETPLDEIRLIPAWRSHMAWDSYYGFPSRFVLETALTPDFTDAVTLHDRTESSLLSPGQNLQCFAAAGKPARYVRMTATRLRNRTGDFVFALGELQAYSGDENVAKGAAVSAAELPDDPEWRSAGLTDGLAKAGVLLELPEWIKQLEQRRLLEMRRKALVQRRAEVFTQAEHTLVGASVGGAGGIVLIAGLFSWRSRRQRIMDRERHRERLARDLHDELGSNLGSIALISSLAALEDPPQMRLDLAEIEQVARESADSMRDMVSLLGGKKGGPAADWLNVMTGLAERLMRGVELECRLPTAPLTWEPNLETRREIYLFCKEVLHNAAKHGHPSHLKFHLSPTSGGLRIEITDDGCGFDPDAVESGHGLGNLRERAAMMKAETRLSSSPGNGTRVVLDVPRGRRWKKR
jgi:signal transduction histidine kinase